MTGTAIRFDDIVFRRGERAILPGISFTVRSGEHWALLGANGAGKSTILSLCGGFAHPTSGTVEVLGERIGRTDLAALRRRIGHVNPRHPIGGSPTVLEVVLTGITGSIETAMRWQPSREQTARAQALVEEFGLGARSASRWPDLSQGERGRALIARALIAEPDLVLLDEPATGLDVAAREQLIETVEHLAATRPALTTVLVTHHLEELPSTTTHALLLRAGAVVAGGPVDESLTTTSVTETFAHPIRIEREHGRWSARSVRHSAA